MTEALYPFLHAHEADVDAVLAEVRQSTVDKAHETAQLRLPVLDRHAAALVAAAEAMAASFAAGGRLLAFGNGGSSTDTAMQTRNSPIILGIFLLVAFAVVMANLLTDLAYGWLDPRISYR